jgi:hypothetical protein
MVVAVAPIPFTGIAWSILRRDSSQISGRLALPVLCLNSASALLFVVTMLLDSSETITQASVPRIAGPNWYLCICIALLSVTKIRRQLYQAVFMSPNSHGPIIVPKRRRWMGYTFNWSNPYVWAVILAIVAVCVVIGFAHR